MLYCVLTLYGSSLLYRDIAADGCDPSGGVKDNMTCESSGPDVFGAMLGVAFAGSLVISGVASFAILPPDLIQLVCVCVVFEHFCFISFQPRG